MIPIFTLTMIIPTQAVTVIAIAQRITDTRKENLSIKLPFQLL